MLRLCRHRHISRRFCVGIAFFCLLLVLLYRITLNYDSSIQATAMKPLSGFKKKQEPVVQCINVRDDYYFLDADIDNQPELGRFIKDMQSVPLLLIDQNVLEKLLFEDSIETHSVESRDFFQFALHEKDWNCLEGSISEVKKEWSFEVDESAIALQHKKKPKVKILVRKLIDKTVDYQVLLPYSGQFLETDQRAVAFVRIQAMSQIVLNDAMVLIPSNPRLFLERLKRGYFIDCQQPEIITAKPLIINKKSIVDLANVRDFFEQLGAMFYLEGGWFRDCSIIEHTTDLDVSVPYEYFTEAFNTSIFNSDFFRIWKQFGRVNDSLEYATFLGPFGRGEKLDIFFNYNTANYTFAGGFAPPDYLLWYELPQRQGYCSGDLYGRLFSVPCNIEEWLSATYGDNFMTKQAANWERENGTYDGARNYRILGRFNESDVSMAFFRHPRYGV